MGSRGDQSRRDERKGHAETYDPQDPVGRQVVEGGEDRKPEQQAVAGARGRGENDDGIGGMHQVSARLVGGRPLAPTFVDWTCVSLTGRSPSVQTPQSPR